MYIRHVNDADRPILDAWIHRDNDHSGKGMTADFFFATMTIAMMFEDDAGPVFAVRLDPEIGGSVRIHIQFDSSQMIRTARTLVDGFAVVHDRIARTRAKRMVFDSLSPALVKFCKKYFGFVDVEGTQDLELLLPAGVEARGMSA